MLQQMHTALMALTSCEANDIVANSRKNPLEAWRRLQKRYDPTTGRRKEEKPSAHDHFSRTVLSSGTPSGDRALGVLRVSLREKDERTGWTTRSTLLVLSHWCGRSLRII